MQIEAQAIINRMANKLAQKEYDIALLETQVETLQHQVTKYEGDSEVKE